MFFDIVMKVMKLKMYLYFDIVYYILMCVVVRDDVLVNFFGKVIQYCYIWLFIVWVLFIIIVVRYYVIWIVLMINNLMEFLIQYVKVD